MTSAACASSSYHPSPLPLPPAQQQDPPSPLPKALFIWKQVSASQNKSIISITKNKISPPNTHKIHIYYASSSCSFLPPQDKQTRGDTLGAALARSLANDIKATAHGGWGFWTNAWRFGWDYARNYAWRSDWETYHEVYGAVSELNDLVSRLGDYTGVQGERERAEWFLRNYRNVLGSAKAVFGRLLGVFARSGPLRDAVEAMKKEVVDGDFLMDCLEIGGNDVKEIIQVLKDLLLRLYYPSDPSKELYIVFGSFTE